MAGMTQPQPDWKQRLKAELQRDKKKSIAMLALLIIGGIVIGRTVVMHGLPEKADASSPTGQTAIVAQPTHGSSANAWTPDAMGAPRSTITARREEHLATLDRSIVRDLFRPDPQMFPPQNASANLASIVVRDPNEATEWFEQVGVWIDQKQQAQHDEVARARAIETQAGALSLQSIMLGDSPSALINGRVLRTGEWISGFQIKSIGPDGCIITREGVDVKLRMRRDGTPSSRSERTFSAGENVAGTPGERWSRSVAARLRT